MRNATLASNHIYFQTKVSIITFVKLAEVVFGAIRANPLGSHVSTPRVHSLSVALRHNVWMDAHVPARTQTHRQHILTLTQQLVPVVDHLFQFRDALAHLRHCARAIHQLAGFRVCKLI
jgi:hypothetical protein